MSIESQHETFTNEHSRRTSQEIQALLLRGRKADDRSGPEAYRGFLDEGRREGEKITAETEPATVHAATDS
jgi:hypothetical protein